MLVRQVPRTPGAAREPDIKDFFLRNGAAYMHPRRVFVLPGMPLTSAKKIDRGTLRKLAEEGRQARREQA